MCSWFFVFRCHISLILTAYGTECVSSAEWSLLQTQHKMTQTGWTSVEPSQVAGTPRSPVQVLSGSDASGDVLAESAEPSEAIEGVALQSVESSGSSAGSSAPSEHVSTLVVTREDSEDAADLPQTPARVRAWDSPHAPLVLGTLAVNILILLVMARTDRFNAAKASDAVLVLAQFVGFFCYSAIIVDSHQLAQSLGMSDSWSGRLVGQAMLGFGLGQVVIFVLLNRVPGIWREWPRTLLLCGVILQMLGVAGFNGALLESGLAHPTVLEVCRVVGGMGIGVHVQVNLGGLTQLTPNSERPDRMVTMLFASILGIGLGPMVMGLVKAGLPCSTLTPGWISLSLLVVQFVSIVSFFPPLTTAECFLAREAHEAAGEDGRKRRSVICGSIFVTACRAFVVVGVEVGVSLLLETHMHWQRSYVGISIGLSVLVCVPVRLLYSSIKGIFTLVTWIRVLVMCALLGCAILFGFGSMAVSWWLLFGGSVLYSSAYLMDGLVTGAMQASCLPDGSWFDLNHSMLWSQMFAALFARFLGPWTVRWCIEVGGQTSFAILIAVVCVASAVLFEALVAPNMELLESK